MLSARPRALSKSEEERGVSIAMEKWLKDKFREGVQRMKSQFDQLDPEQTCKVSLLTARDWRQVKIQYCFTSSQTIGLVLNWRKK